MYTMTMNSAFDLLVLVLYVYDDDEQRLIYWFLCCMYTMTMNSVDLLVLVVYVYDDDEQRLITGSCVVCIR